MSLVQISDYRTLYACEPRSAWLSCAGIESELAKDWILIIELASDGRAYTSKARVTPVSDDTPPFTPLFQSWIGAPCNWQG